ncbi:uncharacterized protein LOC126975583 [Leptidea sinapis]|uniref:uncharacterized protein LOC126975583 n=1 Tax=Leptidea sinapis TaxID=189913 RepID=UPI002142B106|nr:uncharacterized protein LOC126975583 [Leptidea sinapis]
MRICIKLFVLLVVVHISIALLNKTEIHEVNNDLKAANTRRKTHRSTSSSSGDFKKDDNNLGGKSESLEISDSSSSSESVDRDKKSTPAGTGWRKWHRKCTPCPDDMVKKWNDRSIKWICGGYQRARRSFKSSCMMHYRNCQDGTMFLKIHDHRCANSTDDEGPNTYRVHFFYDYKVRSGSGSTASSSESKSDSDSTSE